MVKLNLGCGRHIKEGWVNVDCVEQPGVDVVVNFDESKMPFEDNSVEEFLASHLIEHLSNPLSFMQELHRIAKPEATAIIRCPYGSSDDAFTDPTHVRPYFLGSFGYFSQPFYWRADYKYKGDWQPEEIILHLRKEEHQGKTAAQIMQEVKTLRNVVKEMVVKLKAIKPIREPKKELQKKPKVILNLV
jgi:ubiquinone/menaquinone biosynthesis C-methylase UbiE